MNERKNLWRYERTYTRTHIWTNERTIGRTYQLASNERTNCSQTCINNTGYRPIQVATKRVQIQSEGNVHGGIPRLLLFQYSVNKKYTLDTALKYAPDNAWYILTINEVFELGGSLVREGVAHNLMRLLAEGAPYLVLITKYMLITVITVHLLFYYNISVNSDFFLTKVVPQDFKRTQQCWLRLIVYRYLIEVRRTSARRKREH